MVRDGGEVCGARPKPGIRLPRLTAAKRSIADEVPAAAPLASIRYKWVSSARSPDVSYRRCQSPPRTSLTSMTVPCLPASQQSSARAGCWPQWALFGRGGPRPRSQSNHGRGCTRFAADDLEFARRAVHAASERRRRFRQRSVTSPPRASPLPPVLQAVDVGNKVSSAPKSTHRGARNAGCPARSPAPPRFHLPALHDSMPETWICHARLPVG